jgi:hypothetical protein
VTAFSSVAVGQNALGLGAAFDTATAVGFQAGKVFAGSDIVAIGANAAPATTTGGGNIAVGTGALLRNVTGQSNTIVGDGAGQFITGSSNVIIGSIAGNSMTSGSNNVLVGIGLDALSVSGSNQLAIGINGSHWIDGDSSFGVSMAGGLTVGHNVSTGAAAWLNATIPTGDSSPAVNIYKPGTPSSSLLFATFAAAGKAGIGSGAIKGRFLTIAQSAGDSTAGSTTLTAANNYLSLGEGEFGLNSYRVIGFGYNNTGTYSPAIIGYQETGGSSWPFGDLIFGTRGVDTDTAPTVRMRIYASGGVSVGNSTDPGVGTANVGPIAFASLGTPANGAFTYCNDCKVTSGADDTCVASGSGAQAFRINGAWKCVQ